MRMHLDSSLSRRRMSQHALQNLPARSSREATRMSRHISMSRDQRYLKPLKLLARQKNHNKGKLQIVLASILPSREDRERVYGSYLPAHDTPFVQIFYLCFKGSPIIRCLSTQLFQHSTILDSLAQLPHHVMHPSPCDRVWSETQVYRVLDSLLPALNHSGSIIQSVLHSLLSYTLAFSFYPICEIPFTPPPRSKSSDFPSLAL